jgi:flagellar biosynthesis protein FlhG
MPPEKFIIPIASGKGGVGKSIFAASLATALAGKGYDTVAVDLDLGGSNLHTYLGLSNTSPGVGDYLKQRLPSLQELMIPTGIKNLRFLPGDGKTPFMANIPTAQRFQLLREIQQIEARYIIIDLGAGTSLNTMNFFGLSNRGVIISSLDTPSLMNSLVFLRNFIFANIISLVQENKIIRKELLDAYRLSADSDHLTVADILDRIRSYDPKLAERVKKRCSAFRPAFILNLGDRPEDLKVIGKIEATLSKNLSLNAQFLGMLFYDEAVRKAVRKNEPFLTNNPASLYGRCLEEILARLLDRNKGIEKNNLETLIGEARKNLR